MTRCWQGLDEERAEGPAREVAEARKARPRQHVCDPSRKCEECVYTHARMCVCVRAHAQVISRPALGLAVTSISNTSRGVGVGSSKSHRPGWQVPTGGSADTVGTWVTASSRICLCPQHTGT